MNRRRHKYGVAPKAERTVDGIVFDSKAEARRYGELKMMQRAGKVEWFIRQPTFDLPGGVKYRADFLVVCDSGRVTVEDVKGAKTAVYSIKKKQVEALYPIKIQEIE